MLHIVCTGICFFNLRGLSVAELLKNHFSNTSWKKCIIVIAKNPFRYKLCANFFQILCDSQEYEQADEYFTKAMEKDPQNATIYVHKGLLQLHWNTNIDKAVEYIKSALELDDKCEFGYETLGSIEVQR